MAANLIRRALNVVLGPAEEINGAERCPTYLYRWHLFAVGPVKAYLHHFVGDDWSLDLHDHPKRFVTVGLWGCYAEESCDGRLRLNSALSTYRRYRAPWIRTFPATHCHRIFKPLNCWTLAFVGPAQRDWGFWHRGWFVPFKEYVYGALGDQMKACA